MEDSLISRQAAIDEVRFGQSYITKISPDGTLEHLFDAENKALEEAVKRIEQLPPIKPAEKVGRWIDYQEDRWIYAKCSECETVHDTRTNYCPNCGSRMMQEVKE